MQDIYSSSSHLSINIHPHVFIFELNAVGAEVIIATTLLLVLGTLGTCDSIRCNHARVGGLIPLLLEFATEWNKGFSGILS